MLSSGGLSEMEPKRSRVNLREVKDGGHAWRLSMNSESTKVKNALENS